jgi:ubiquinone biosynthesis protein UbiJ
MLAKAALALVNHLLTSEPWARRRLVSFAGRSARLQFGADAAWLLRINESGLFEIAEPGTPATVSIGLPADAPARALIDSASIFSSATISGSADLAETLGFVVRNLRWDAEHDLSRLLGDVVARRGLRLARDLTRWQIDGVRKLALGVAEYLTEEDAAIARRRDIESFCAEVDALRDDLARFEKRLGRAELA